MLLLWASAQKKLEIGVSARIQVHGVSLQTFGRGEKAAVCASCPKHVTCLATLWWAVPAGRVSVTTMLVLGEVVMRCAPF